MSTGSICSYHNILFTRSGLGKRQCNILVNGHDERLVKVPDLISDID